MNSIAGINLVNIEQATKKSRASFLQGLQSSSTFSNSVYWIGARLFSGLARICVLLLIARIYGPANFGEISLAISLTEILRTISECGLDTIAIRRFRLCPPSDFSRLLGSIIGTKLVLAASGYALVLTILGLFVKSGNILLLGAVTGLSLFSANVVGAFTSYFQSRFSMAQVLSTTLQSVAFLAAWTGFCITLRWPIPVLIAGIPLAEGINAALLWIRSREPIRLEFHLREMAELLAQSLPVGLMGALVILYMRLDNFFVFHFSGEIALGLYSVAYRSIEPVLMIPHSFAITLYSYLSGQQPGSGVENKISFGYVLESMWPAYAFAAFAMVAVIAGGKYFLAHWFPAYLPVFPIMRLLAVLLLVRTINITLTAILYSFGRYTTLLKITGTNLLANVVFAFALIPSFGLWGAGLAALLTETWNCCAQWRAVWASVSFLREQAPVCRFERDAKPDADLVAP